MEKKISKEMVNAANRVYRHTSNNRMKTHEKTYEQCQLGKMQIRTTVKYQNTLIKNSANVKSCNRKHCPQCGKMTLIRCW